MEHFNPGLQKLVALGNSYVKAFRALAVCSEDYFSAVAKMGEQALQTFTSHSLGDVLIQISETQRRLTVEMDGVFQWFQIEVLQAMEKKVKLDEEYIQAGTSLQQKADGWKQKVNDTRGSRPRTPTYLDQESQQLRGSVSSLLQTVARDEDMSWARREQQALGRVPSRAPSPLPSRSRSSSVGDCLGLGVGRSMRALVSHPTSNPNLLPFNREELVTVLVQEPRNGWLYGRTDSNLRQGWFPAAYVVPTQDFSMATSSGSLRSHSLNNLLDPANSYIKEPESKSYGDIPPPTTPIRRASVDVRAISPHPERNYELTVELKHGHSKSHIDQTPPPPPPPPPPAPSQSLRGSVDLRTVSPLPEKKHESASEVQRHKPLRNSEASPDDNQR
ncbi:hypothetical protein fugu_007615 [Takifugu bimaculatus]|uniref:Brain-specific angiogenesis inhibitor 1-associated protein 2-like protein 2 n=1 Tax=Takifugu bimaculatus TaxID=433685 RepID=A0A4Z2AZ38_9TELE|nr:hypothetical protein fugu_007615 [Takifugu bimaculatus]